MDELLLPDILDLISPKQTVLNQSVNDDYLKRNYVIVIMNYQHKERGRRRGNDRQIRSLRKEGGRKEGSRVSFHCIVLLYIIGKDLSSITNYIYKAPSST